MYDINMQCHIAIQWMAHRGILLEWLEEITNREYIKFFMDNFEDSCNDMEDASEFFVSMPSWMNTRKGMSYWSEISEEWGRYLSNLLETDYE